MFQKIQDVFLPGKETLQDSLRLILRKNKHYIQCSHIHKVRETSSGSHPTIWSISYRNVDEQSTQMGLDRSQGLRTQNGWLRFVVVVVVVAVQIRQQLSL